MYPKGFCSVELLTSLLFICKQWIVINVTSSLKNCEFWEHKTLC